MLTDDDAESLRALGMDAETAPSDAEIEALVAQRQAARKARDFAASDRIRQELAERGILFEDTRDGGIRWKRKSTRAPVDAASPHASLARRSFREVAMSESKLPRRDYGPSGPRSEARSRTRSAVYFAVLHAQLSAGGPSRPRRADRRRRRQRIPRFQRRHCRRLYRPLPSRSRRRDPEAGRRNSFTCPGPISTTPNMVELAQKLAAIAPGPGAKRVYFGNSGTEAIEAAIKLARYHTRREKIVAFYGAFHGRTMGSLSLTASKAVQRRGFGALLAGVFHVPYANPYRCPYGKPPDSCCTECAAFLERELFKRIVDPEEVAAMVVEPIQGEGGYVPAPSRISCCNCNDLPPPRHPARRRRGADRHGPYRQMVGGRPRRNRARHSVRRQGHRFRHAAFRDRSRAPSVMDWPPGAHASTFGGNPVCVAAALATLRLIETQYMENARRMGEYMFARLADWRNEFRIVGDVRGKGLMIGIEIVKDQKTKEPAPDIRDAIVAARSPRGFWSSAREKTPCALLRRW